MIKNISKYFNVFKRPKSLKMKAQESYASFKRKGSSLASNVKTFAENNPKKTVAGIAGLGIGLGLYNESKYVDINKDPNLLKVNNMLNKNKATKDMPIKIGFFSRTKKQK